MFNWIRQQFCKHELQIVKSNEYGFGTITTYMCPKCGYIRKVKTYPWWYS